VAAQSGTLVKRFVGTPAAGRLAAKTGSLDQVTALSGFMRGPSPLIFALVANDLPRDEAGRVLADRIGVALASYPDAPDPSTLAPR
jgi:D-alanyl-D-alanine carboxypeptidase/D-alanyl-D-alanine-endopeptidase (penicillin-binding protein 4)